MVRRRRWALVVAPLAVLVAGCTKGEIAQLPPPPSVPLTTTTAAIDLSGIALKEVPGRTTSTIALQPGSATISGAVVGPDGPVADAVVRAERVVGESAGSIDIRSGPDGRFAFTTMLGGRYRVRAWKSSPENLAAIEPQVFFLEGAESKVITLTVRRYQGANITSAIAPNPPMLDEPANLVVQVVDQAVDGEGIVRSVGLPDVRVELFGAGEWVLRSANPATSDTNGRVSFTVVCKRAGQQPLSVVVGDATTFPLDLPPCAAPTEAPEPEPTTTTVASATTTAPRSTTTAPRSTTTTTARATTTTR